MGELLQLIISSWLNDKFHSMKQLTGLSSNMCSSNIATEFVQTGIKKERTRILQSPVILDKMCPDDTKVYAPKLDTWVRKSWR